MHPFPLAGAIGLAVFLVVRRKRLGRVVLALGVLAVVGLALWGTGVVEPPSLTTLIEDVGKRLGKWTYLLVGALAFLETGAFVGLVAPGETAVLIGGVVAGQGEISITLLIGIVWACAVAGDVTSYVLGRKLGRGFLVRHGPRLKITEERLRYVEDFFDRRGGVTILIGRFIGLVRAIAPFIAGASRMEMRKFIPYDVLGAGLWATLFCLLGYFFWQSLDRVEAFIGRGAAAFTGLVAVGLAVWFIRKLRRDQEFRAKVQRRLDGNPMYRRVRKPLFFVADHATFALELSTLLALAAVGAYLFFVLGMLIGPEPTAPFDDEAFDVLGSFYTDPVGDVIRVLTHVGSYPVTGVIVIATATWAARHGRAREGIALVVAHVLLFAAVHIAKDAEGRPRPSDQLSDTEGLAYPSGHSAYAIAWVACAVVMARGGHHWSTRFAIVTIAIVIAAAVGATRIYLRAHYLSDVIGGFALATAIYALCGVVALVIGTVRNTEGR
ncbi:MAG TPA: VTT domain-containing protein [Solirubrobacteraceae bacterium]|nr:VTT domain-containing protein [Solirubrobacteraceae bacterium]